MQWDLGLSPRTVRAYASSLADYLGFCDRVGVDAVAAGRADIARYVRDLRERPGRHGANVIALASGAGLSVATLQLRVTVVRLFYDFVVEEGVRDRSPVGRGYRSADGRAGRRGLVGRTDRLPWIPTDAQWRAVLEVAAGETLRNRLMLALAYDAALRREELCLLGTDDLDPAFRTITVPGGDDEEPSQPGCSVFGGFGTSCWRATSADRRQITTARGALFGVRSPRNRGAGVSPWTWSKVVRSIAVRAGVPGVQHAHTQTSVLDGSGAVGVGDRSDRDRSPGTAPTDTTQRYIHLSGRDLAERLGPGMTQIHAPADRAPRRGADMTALAAERLGGSAEAGVGAGAERQSV